MNDAMEIVIKDGETFFYTSRVALLDLDWLIDEAPDLIPGAMQDIAEANLSHEIRKRALDRLRAALPQEKLEEMTAELASRRAVFETVEMTTNPNGTVATGHVKFWSNDGLAQMLGVKVEDAQAWGLEHFDTIAEYLWAQFGLRWERRSDSLDDSRAVAMAEVRAGAAHDQVVNALLQSSGSRLVHEGFSAERHSYMWTDIIDLVFEEANER